MQIEFYKYHGCGNDFVIVDNRDGRYPEFSAGQVKKICTRRFGVGADGLMVMKQHESLDFEMLYYNADGKPGTMCGNGGRCMIKFARQRGIKKETYHFTAVDGLHEATIDDKGWINLKMNDVMGIRNAGSHYILDTGSPHYVQPVNDIMGVDVYNKGRHIRYNREFEEKGINVNFVETIDDNTIYVRTYERGVEDETLSCGTGVTAAALVSAHNERGFNAINIKTPGGRLRVEFDRTGEDSFENIWLCGPAEFVFSGAIEVGEDE
jgi:diaminopimelate epimerase